MENFRTVTIDIESYDQLREAAIKLDMLLDALYNNAHTSYNKRFLSFSDEPICHVLKVIDPAYESTLAAVNGRNENERTD